MAEVDRAQDHPEVGAGRQADRVLRDAADSAVQAGRFEYVVPLLSGMRMNKAFYTSAVPLKSGTTYFERASISSQLGFRIECSGSS